MDTPLRIAIVYPPLAGHAKRGIGSYSGNLIHVLEKNSLVDIRVIKLNEFSSDADVIHYPYFDPFFLTLPLIKHKITTVTVHDVIPLKFPDKFPVGFKGRMKWWIQKFSLMHSTAVITDSYASQEDIKKYTGISKDKSQVIYPGVDKAFQKNSNKAMLREVKEKYRLPDDYILYVGDVNYNKNVPGLIRAFGKVAGNDKTVHLVLVGEGFVQPSVERTIVMKEIASIDCKERIHIIGFIPLDHLVCIYNLAKVLVQPSFAEGFGLPILEAMATGCPIVASKLSSLSEIAGDAALLVDPLNVNAIAQSVDTLLHNTSMRNTLTQRGFERVKQFQWERAAEQYVTLWKKILKQGPSI